MRPISTAKSTRPASAFIFFLLGFSALPAQAYLDPGSGSLIIQSVIGAVAAFSITVKLYWHKIRLKLGGHKASEPEVKSQDQRSTTE